MRQHLSTLATFHTPKLGKILFKSKFAPYPLDVQNSRKSRFSKLITHIVNIYVSSTELHL